MTQYIHTEKESGDIIEPDLFQAQSQAHLEFYAAASKLLSDFRKQWREDHDGENETYAQGMELDLVPVGYEGDIYGYLVISEIDGESYDYAPILRTRKADQK